MANRASKGCQACFLEARESAQHSSSPQSEYWRDTLQVFAAASSLRRQWGIRAATRSFVNTGASVCLCASLSESLWCKMM